MAPPACWMPAPAPASPPCCTPVPSLPSDRFPGAELGDETTPYDWHSLGIAYFDTKYEAERMVLGDPRVAAVVVNPGLVFGAGDLNGNALRFVREVAAGVPGYPPGGTTAAVLADVVSGHLAALDRGRGRPTLHSRWTCPVVSGVVRRHRRSGGRGRAAAPAGPVDARHDGAGAHRRQPPERARAAAIPAHLPHPDPQPPLSFGQGSRRARLRGVPPSRPACARVGSGIWIASGASAPKTAALGAPLLAHPVRKPRLPDLSQNQVTLLAADRRPTRRRA